MFTFMMFPQTHSNDTVEVVGVSLSPGGNTLSVDGLEMFTWSNPESEWTWWRTNLTIYVLSGFLRIKYLYQQEMKNGSASLAMNS
jgi:hypothetical protein